MDALDTRPSKALFICNRHGDLVLSQIIKSHEPTLIITTRRDLRIKGLDVITVSDLIHPNTVLESDSELLWECYRSLSSRRNREKDPYSHPFGFLVSVLFDFRRSEIFLSGLLQTRLLHLGGNRPLEVDLCCEHELKSASLNFNSYESDWGYHDNIFTGHKVYCAPAQLEEDRESDRSSAIDDVAKHLTSRDSPLEVVNLWTTFDRNTESALLHFINLLKDPERTFVIHTSERFAVDFANSPLILNESVSIKLIERPSAISHSLRRANLKNNARSLWRKLSHSRFVPSLKKTQRRLDSLKKLLLSHERIRVSTAFEQFERKSMLGSSYAQQFSDANEVHVFFNLRWPEFASARVILEAYEIETHAVQLVLHANDPRYLLQLPKSLFAPSPNEFSGAQRLSDLNKSRLSPKKIGAELGQSHHEYRSLLLSLTEVPSRKLRQNLREKKVAFVGQGLPASLTYNLLLVSAELSQQKELHYFPHPTEHDAVTSSIQKSCLEHDLRVIVRRGVPTSTDFVYFGVNSNVLFARAEAGRTVVQFLIEHIVRPYFAPLIIGPSVFYICADELQKT